MRCCEFCGFTKLHLQWTHFNVVPNTLGIVVGATPYGCSNIIIFTYTTTNDGLHVYVCNACLKFYEQLEWIKYVVFESMKQILVNNLLHLQLLSLIDISMKIEQWNYGFMHNHLGYLTILYSIGIPSFNQLLHQKMLIWPSKIFCTKIWLQIHLYKNISSILRSKIKLMDNLFYFFQL